jgi:hypothetical protein
MQSSSCVAGSNAHARSAATKATVSEGCAVPSHPDGSALPSASVVEGDGDTAVAGTVLDLVAADAVVGVVVDGGDELQAAAIRKKAISDRIGRIGSGVTLHPGSRPGDLPCVLDQSEAMTPSGMSKFA